MKNLLLLFVCTVVFVNVSFPQALDAKFSFASFYKNKVGTYVETYVQLEGDSLHYIKNEYGILQSSVEITMLFKNVDAIKEFRKFNVVSPLISDTVTVFPDVIDLRRIPIQNGIYNFDLIIKDNYAPDSIKQFFHSSIVAVNIAPDELSYSGIELLNSRKISYVENIFVKNGHTCIPLVGEELGAKQPLRLYMEIYNAAKTLGPLNLMVTDFYIEKAFTGKVVRGMEVHSIDRALNFNEMYEYIDIDKLVPGDYFLCVVTKDSVNNIVASTKKHFSKKGMFIYRNIDYSAINISTEFGEIDSISNYITWLSPIADKQESYFLHNKLDSTSIDIKNKFFAKFWIDRSPNNAIDLWNDYKRKVWFAKANYGNVDDRGKMLDNQYIYLKYGMPSSIQTHVSEQNIQKYEVWNYLQLGDLTNRKFIFKLAKSGDYKLVKTNMKGESHTLNF